MRKKEPPPGDAIISTDDAKLTIKASSHKSPLAILAALSPLDDEFLEIDDSAPDAVDL